MQSCSQLCPCADVQCVSAVCVCSTGSLLCLANARVFAPTGNQSINQLLLLLFLYRSIGCSTGISINVYVYVYVYVFVYLHVYVHVYVLYMNVNV